MKRVLRTCRRSTLVVLLTLAIGLISPGCSRGPGSPHPVDPALARQTLETVLLGWQTGSVPDDFRVQDPEIVVQDMDWLMGKQLADFEIVDEGTAVDANLQCVVKLSLIDAKQTATEKTVTYLVGTSPRLTVFRQVVP